MTRKSAFFEGWSWFKFNNLGLALGTNLKFYASLTKGLKVRKFWGLIRTFIEVTGEKLVEGAFLPPILNRVKANGTEKVFRMLLSVVLQGSILGAILFNLFINELLFFIEQAKLTNFAQDNAIYVGSKYLTEIIEILQKECKTAINWFKTNNIIVNPYKFQSMIISSKKDLIKSVLRSQNTFFS